MPLSWNEIKDRAIAFSKDWADTSNEDADAKPFLVEFFNVFGISSKRVSTFEHRVKKLDDRDGYIDLLWKGTILIEMKSRGKNLEKAYNQAIDYTYGLKQHELPKFILVCDFANFKLYDLEEGKTSEFTLDQLVNNVHQFGFLLGYQKKIYKEQDPANIEAAELMGKLHDQLKEIGYEGHPLEVYLVRILFCLFSDDTTIFEKNQFQEFIDQRTSIDGSDLAPKLQELFQVLNTPHDKRFKNLDEQLGSFPYINGKLFEEILPMASFDNKMREALLSCCQIDWSKISPAIFGSMFQSVMNPKERRNLGAHYTSEKNILKLIKPLFLDELWEDFHRVKDNRNKLLEFHKKLSSLKFLDPACGCGNFLVITYRELRLLELEILRALNKTGQRFLNIGDIIWLNVDQFYGIEYEEFPARIAEVAMWLIDHQMNMIISQEFGQYFARLPLKKAARIFHGNALLIDWYSLIDMQSEEQIEVNRGNDCINCMPDKYDYILGNPPFLGKSNQNAQQKLEISSLFHGYKGTGVLDYVTAWYLKAARLIQNSTTKVAFVSTNSISQGEQVGILWDILFNHYNIKIHFAHQTFRWKNEAKDNAAVHVVIIGFGNFDISNKFLFEYNDPNGEPHRKRVKNINPYLVEGKDLLILKRTKSLCISPIMNYGSMPNDGGYLLLSEVERDELLFKEPGALRIIRKFIMGEELINNIPRFCLWMPNIKPEEMSGLSEIMKRVRFVYDVRSSSKREATIKLAQFPSLFGEIRQPETDYIALPRVSSVNRKYIPIAIMDKEVIAGDKVYTISSSNKYVFGVLTSTMHMSWMRVTSGRLKSDYSYSNQLTYNNFPWPENPSEKQREAVERTAQKVLDVRAEYPGSSLADLYDPLTMPPVLVKAHNDLDRAVDLAYRPQPFLSDAKRMEFLFELYEKYTANQYAKREKLKKNKD